jgi:hypothetical protein
LTQVSDKNDWSSGTVTDDIVGTSGGSKCAPAHRKLTQVETYPLAFKFHYFQDFTGTLTVPDGMKPDQVVVTRRYPERTASEFRRPSAGRSRRIEMMSKKPVTKMGKGATLIPKTPRSLVTCDSLRSALVRQRPHRR